MWEGSGCSHEAVAAIEQHSEKRVPGANPVQPDPKTKKPLEQTPVENMTLVANMKPHTGSESDLTAILLAFHFQHAYCKHRLEIFVKYFF
jgi:Tfp pilus assembly protein PilP